MEGWRREQRRGRREPMRHAAWIRCDSIPNPMTCVVWDLSEGGARLRAAQPQALPQVFTLVLDRQGKASRPCRVVWRKQSAIGVKFIHADEAEALADAARRKSWTPPPDAQEATVALDHARQAVKSHWRRSDIASGAQKSRVTMSSVALVFMFMLWAATGVLYAAGLQLDGGAAWAADVCSRVGNLCEHPEWSGISGALMAFVYFIANGMEM